MGDGLRTLLDRAMASFNALLLADQAEHRRLQRESFVRGMTTPCEHGVLDFESCRECRK